MRNYLCELLAPGHVPMPFHTAWQLGQTFQELRSASCSHKELNIDVKYTYSHECKAQPLTALRAETGDDAGEGTVHLFNCGLHMLHLFPARPYEYLADTLLLEERLQAVARRNSEVRAAWVPACMAECREATHRGTLM